jgi:hypothetical protein
MRRDQTSGSRQFGEGSVISESISAKKAVPLVLTKIFLEVRD